MRISLFPALVAGWLAVGAVVVALVYAGHQAAMDRAERSSAALALAVEEHTVRVFQTVSLSLGAIADDYQFARPPARHDPAFQRLLVRRLEKLPYVRGLYIIAADGQIAHDTDWPTTPSGSLADAPYFQAHWADPKPDLRVSGPMTSTTPGLGWFIAVSHTMRRAGAFDGVAVAAVQPGYFEMVYRRMELGEGDAIALFHAGGDLVARFPRREQDIGKSFRDRPLFLSRVPQAPAGTYVTGSGMSAGGQIVSYRVVEGLPLVVRVSHSVGATLTDWRRTAIGAALAMGILTLLLAALIFNLLRQRQRREEARERRAQSEKLAALGQLTGGIAHDFGNLLGVISLNLHLLSLNDPGGPVASQALAVAQRTVKRGGELISRLLAFARQQPLQLQPADLNPLVERCHALLAQAAGQRIGVHLQLAPALPRCMVDETLLETALLNLVINAAHALGGAGRIIVSTYPCAEEECVGLVVRDNGPGMAQEVQRRALEPFFTTKGAEGTGLGLPQVYGFMQQIGGTLRIESAPGAGTEVHLLFRIARAE
jgi:two-component system, NtrC family, sensor kinase